MTIALLAGEGDLPKKIFARLKDCVLINFSDKNKDWACGTHYTMPLGRVGGVLDILRQHHVTDVVFAGAIKRPALSDLSLDKKGFQLLKKIGFWNFGKDDYVLTSITAFLEDEGFKVLPASTFLDNLYVPKGVLTEQKPSASMQHDIERARQILADLSVHDIGQSLVIQQHSVLGIEAAEGTQVLIKRCAAYRCETGEPPLLVKLAKLSQSQKVDLPTVGLETLHDLQHYGYGGMIISAGTAQFLDQEEGVRFANAHKLIIMAINEN